ncbi:MAG: spoIIQ 1 [Acidobacteria bacterium]|jgi:murein DD-endopeptidase MepM/ murein hydrolase activator NlpD|nr:spoIIQ 1 [Acidobacteriota bacterium]
MLSKRFTVVIADRDTGVVRRVTVSARVLAFAAALLFGLPLLMGLGARWSVSTELARLSSTNGALQMENDSYRAATGELASQISSLQAVVTELGVRSEADPATAKAIKALPTVVRNQATGGAPRSASAARAAVAAAMAPSESTFGLLRDLLGSLEDRLRIVRSDVERWEALSRATPSIWPAVGWLTDRFGGRADPFTGEPDYHLGLDISADKGDPVRATADGVITNANYSGAFGNLVVVQHEFGITTRYAHLSKFAVQAGQRVRRGDVLGYVGATGRASGPHVHYEVWADGKPINPLKLLTGPSAR